MTDLSQRRREVDLEAMSGDDAERVGEELGKKIGEICTEAQEKINKLLGPYGESCIVAIQFLDKKTGKPKEAVTF